MYLQCDSVACWRAWVAAQEVVCGASAAWRTSIQHNRPDTQRTSSRASGPVDMRLLLASETPEGLRIRNTEINFKKQSDAAIWRWATRQWRWRRSAAYLQLQRLLPSAQYLLTGRSRSPSSPPGVQPRKSRLDTQGTRGGRTSKTGKLNDKSQRRHVLQSFFLLF